MRFIILLFITQFVQGQSSELEDFQNGNVKKFISNGTGKADGLKFSVKYPYNYTSVDGDRPHVIRKFYNKDERSGNASFVSDFLTEF